MRSSIDDYLRINREDPVLVAVGKMAIFEAIASGEMVARQKILKQSGNQLEINASDIKKSWYWPLWTILSDGLERSTAEHMLEHVTFINFNYDRCLELFLSQIIAQTTGTLFEHAYSLVVKRMIHPYGCLGHLIEPGAVSFGPTPEGYGLDAGALRIRTFFEACESDLAIKLHSEMITARNIVFVGFGFHDQNMQLLRTWIGDDETPPPRRHTRIFATLVKTTAEERRVFEARVRETIWPNGDTGYMPADHSLSAADMLRDARFTLSQA